MHFVKYSAVILTLFAGGAAASAQGREELDSGIHGNNAPASMSARQTYQVEVNPNFRSAHAHAHQERTQRPAQPAGNPLLDDIHGGPAR